MDNIYNLLLQRLNWVNNSFTYELYPFDNDTIIKCRYIKFVFYKNGDKYRGFVTIETTKHCLLHPDEVESKKEDFAQFKFNTSEYKKFKQCVLQCLNIIKDVQHCVSCHRFHLPKHLDNSICLDCRLQFMIEQNEECSICYDSTEPKLHQVLPCKHSFHFNCLVQMKKRECPLCRHPFRFK